MVVALASADDAAARRGLEALRPSAGADRFGFVVRDGFALVAKGGRDAQSAADQADAQAQQESPAAAAAFQRGRAWLPAQQTAIGWADLQLLGAAIRTSARSLWDVPDIDPAGGAKPGSGGAQLGSRPDGQPQGGR